MTSDIPCDVAPSEHNSLMECSLPSFVSSYLDIVGKESHFFKASVMLKTAFSYHSKYVYIYYNTVYGINYHTQVIGDSPGDVSEEPVR